jgi:hypothetical protein
VHDKSLKRPRVALYASGPTNPAKLNHNPRRRRAGLRATVHAHPEISMSLSAIDAMLRERRLAAMRAEIEESLNVRPPEGRPGRGYDPNQLLLGGNPDADSWTSTRVAPGTELAAAAGKTYLVVRLAGDHWDERKAIRCAIWREL